MTTTTFALADVVEMLEAEGWTRSRGPVLAGTVVVTVDGDHPAAVQLEVDDDDVCVDFSNGRNAADVFRFDLGAAYGDEGELTERVVRVILAATGA